MATFEIDPTQGPHAASRLSDEDLDFLQQLVAVELAIRLDKKVYVKRFSGLAAHRDDMDGMVRDWRNQRDRMIFVASVTADLEQLPVLEDR